MSRKTHIQELFDNINGGDCVDSASEAQEISEAMLAALEDLQMRMTQAAIASTIGKKNKTEFLLGEIERNKVIVAAAIAKANGLTDDESKCRQCGEPCDNGEGWDGLCGNCADRAEKARGK